jgi:hypothetical protein
MANPDVKAIQERLDKAIPGPYFSVFGFDDGLNVCVKDGNDCHIATEEQEEIFTHAWQDIKDLLEDNKRLREALDEANLNLYGAYE